MIDRTRGQLAQLPRVTANDLNGMRRTLPDGRLNVLAIAYERWQQLEVDTWVPTLAGLEREHDELSYFEVPVAGEMDTFGRRSLDFYMRRGIPDPEVRARTLTFYADAAGFRAPLGIPDEDHIAIVLVDRDGLVLWRGSGPHAPGAERALHAAVKAAMHPPVH